MINNHHAVANLTTEQTFDVIAQHLPFLTRVVRSLVQNDQLAEDIVQQTILKALTNAAKFRFESALETWLTSIAINEIRQAYRSGWRRRAVPLLTEVVDTAHCQTAGFAPADYEIRERELLVRDAVARLPYMYRSVLELCDFQRLSLKEAARRLGLSLPAVKTRRRRARLKLRPLVAQLGD